MFRQFSKTRVLKKIYLQNVLENEINKAKAYPLSSYRALHLYKHKQVPEKALHKLDVPQTSTLNKGPNAFTSRTHTCGELNTNNVGEHVVLYGWLEFQRMNKFLTLRDAYGVTQVIVPESLKDRFVIENIPYESILMVSGTVALRPKDMVNLKQKTGHIEIITESLVLINEVQHKLPFDIRNFNKAKEHLRLKHRYLDLRFPEMQHNLRLRSDMLLKIRKYLIEEQAFTEVETPTLFRRTPGGAQEFIVPTRNKGQFYSLVQSPQQFKQMLMAGAVDRYFQFARCYRDEGSRPDRQPEFTQLDIELAYPQTNGILTLVEELLYKSWPIDKNNIEIPFPRLSYKQAMNKYGSDKPDIRFGFELTDITTTITKYQDLSKGYKDFGCYMIKIPKPQVIFTKSIKNKLQDLSKKYKDVKFIQSLIITDWTTSKLSNLLKQDVLTSLQLDYDLKSDDLVFIGYGNKLETQTLLGKVRVLYKDLLEANNIDVTKTTKAEWNFLWITDFPLFTLEDSNTLTSTHHPFTAPHPDDLSKLDTDPLNVRSLAYDLVLNGSEIAGGSIRIHDPNMQKRILQQYLKIDHSHLEHLITALGSGCPPHGGIALGIDRLISIICGTSTIRDVIAFPKTIDGKDPLSGAPVELSDEEKAMYHIQSLNK